MVCFLLFYHQSASLILIRVKICGNWKHYLRIWLHSKTQNNHLISSKYFYYKWIYNSANWLNIELSKPKISLCKIKCFQVVCFLLFKCKNNELIFPLLSQFPLIVLKRRNINANNLLIFYVEQHLKFRKLNSLISLNSIKARNYSFDVFKDGSQ